MSKTITEKNITEFPIQIKIATDYWMFLLVYGLQHIALK